MTDTHRFGKYHILMLSVGKTLEEILELMCITSQASAVIAGKRPMQRNAFRRPTVRKGIVRHPETA
jgi:hypothetical protein